MAQPLDYGLMQGTGGTHSCPCHPALRRSAGASPAHQVSGDERLGPAASHLVSGRDRHCHHRRRGDARRTGTAQAETVYVIHQSARAVTPISTITNTAGKPIRVGSGPIAIAVTPDGKTIYVANGYSDTVTPITTATNTPGKPIRAEDGPGRIAITPDGKTAYVVNFESGTVTPITTATNTAGKPIKVGKWPQAITVTPDGKTVYVANWGSDT